MRIFLICIIILLSLIKFGSSNDNNKIRLKKEGTKRFNFNNESQIDFGKLFGKSNKIKKIRTQRGLLYSNGHYINPEYLEPTFYTEQSAPSPHIIDFVAPRKQSKDTGIAELLLVLAPLAAIPLIGSAALTTFTTLFATGAYAGKRKRRETQDIASQHALHHQIINDKIQFVNQYHSDQMENIRKQQYNANVNANVNYTSSNGLYQSGSNDWKVFNPIGINHKEKKSDNRFVKFSIEDATLNHHYPKNPFENYYGNNSSLKSNIRNITSLEIVWEEDDKRYKDMLSSSFLSQRDQQNDKLYKDTLSKDMLSKDTLSKDTLSKDTLSKDTLSKDTLSKDMLSSDFVSKRDELHDLESSTSRKDEDKLFRKELPFRKKQAEESLILKNRNDSFLLLEINEWKKKDKKKLDNDSYKLKLNNGKVEIDIKNAYGKTDIRDLDSRETGIVISNGDKVAKRNHRSDPNSWIPFLPNPYLKSEDEDKDKDKDEDENGKREIHELDIIQKYLNKMGKPDYNDEIIATYLSCNGMLSMSNHCLERLTCQFSDSNSGIKQLEKDVASLVIYSLLKNNYIDDEFKNRLRRAAFFGRDNPGKCTIYVCPKSNYNQRTNKRKNKSQ